MRRLCSVALALLAVAVAQLGAAGTSRANDHHQGPPDGYVAHWDAVGADAFTASGLTPAEGHVIFAYEAIAVYDRTVRQVLARHFQRARR